RVLKAIATALNMSAEALMVQAGLLDGHDEGQEARTVVDAVRADAGLTDDQKQALLAVYRSYVESNEPSPDATSRPAEGGPGGSGAQQERE
ncbi:MAG TPA: hypothetical protein VFQ15_09895, partial [Jiangellaceae bacterium]|nr:hypothetical protein [Jiangellaceae bacterium]